MFLFAVVVIVVNTRTGLRTLEPSCVRDGAVVRRERVAAWRTVLIPGALPAMMSGYLLGLGRAMTGMIAVELLLIAVGVGRLILDFQGRFELGAVYATIMLVVAEAVILLQHL